ncbi:LruC domain-containing protein [Prevotella sp. E9-3]|uniref:LruC domain-containing protein n=1 Tax=Prevotella sp. E9-3 TaxID=2913621 RepID=UPI001EDA195D|nr:LruC domain-containing protein [Prevotella sp. E9-3]UKK47454.1 LruC domain-containing protein [Prevotella sp. E9-3]
MKKLLILAAVLAIVSSCKEKDLYEGPQDMAMTSNPFDFSTIKSIDLTVDYSAYELKSPVFFSIYTEYPFTGEDESSTLREDLLPIYEGFTEPDGKFAQNINLPAYADYLYVVTGNFRIQKTMSGKVVDGKAMFVASKTNNTKRAARRAADVGGPLTTSMQTLYQLSNMVNVSTGDDTGVQIYKPWKVALGEWDSQSGRPAYLLDKETADPRLLFTDEEMDGLYETVSNALVASKTCHDVYRAQADLTLEKASDVTVTFLGSMTCWNNSLGYYYYHEDEVPVKPEDLNIIMLFPNIQDGLWDRDWFKKVPNFYGNISLERGDVVQLMYYPNIANGDMSGATTVFPKGTKIGFILKSNGWGMQKTVDGKKYFNNYNGFGSEMPLARQYNVWATSTDGLSYCNTSGLNPADCQYQNPDGLSRTAKFAYKSTESGQEYPIVGFEDACNDLDYDDVILALKPADVFAPLPVVEDKKTTTVGVYAFEDLWPAAGDYDMNDVMVEMAREITYEVTNGTSYKVKKETLKFTTDQNYVTRTSGLAVTLGINWKTTSINMKKVAANSNDTIETTFQKDGSVYLLTNDVKGELGTTYIIEINYDGGFNVMSKTATVKPFIFRDEAEGRWEVHVPFEAPTKNMNTSLFGTVDDRSVPAEGKYFVRDSDYPFAFYMHGVQLANFKETILKKDNERTKISDIYPTFLNWSQSKGNNNADWYLHPAE